MNKLVVVVVVLVALVGGFFLFSSSVSQEKQGSDDKDAESLTDGASAVSPPPTSASVQKDQILPPPPSPKPAVQQQHFTPQPPSPQTNSDEPPLKLKGIGVNFEDFTFTKEKLQFGRLFMGFGFVIPGSSSSSGQDKSNPQPTYVLPLGTPVRSIVDGVVAAIPTLWSGDVSIQVTANGKMEKWVYETEHLINPKVAVGDKVVAGQIIGEVGSFGNGDPPGYGAVEIGLVKGGQTPQHVCPFAYLDDSIREATFAKMRDLFQSWEEYVGDQTLYSDTQIPGCVTLNPIEG
ncbi:M23 family metallopeptidase [Candidatus Kaiserbacteria bacterium]|nr:M23 family metallopeptidase [Candidatus Kaiserbacteria bacterium]